MTKTHNDLDNMESQLHIEKNCCNKHCFEFCDYCSDCFQCIWQPIICIILIIIIGLFSGMFFVWLYIERTIGHSPVKNIFVEASDSFVLTLIWIGGGIFTILVLYGVLCCICGKACNE